MRRGVVRVGIPTPVRNGRTILGSDSSPALPRVIGRYRLLRPIGAGGMATVYLAEVPDRIGAERLAALKLMHERFASEPNMVALFADEAMVSSALSHPNVCRVFDHGVAAGHHYLAMEYLCGESLVEVRASLREALRAGTIGGPTWLAIVARILAQACEGAHAVHQLCDARGRACKAIHRDVSPDNLMVTCNGTVKLLDFGIVRAAVQRHRTEPGVWKGKLAYLSPESYLGECPDQRSDVWALGVVAWELLTGRRLFRRPTEAATLSAVLTGPIFAPSSSGHPIPSDLDEAVMRALERDPSARTMSARELGSSILRAAGRVADAVEASTIESWLARRHGHSPACYARHLDAIGGALRRSEAPDAVRTCRFSNGTARSGLAPSQRTERPRVESAHLRDLRRAAEPELEPKHRRRFAGIVCALGCLFTPSEIGFEHADMAREAALARFVGRSTPNEPQRVSVELRVGGDVVLRAPIALPSNQINPAAPSTP